MEPFKLRRWKRASSPDSIALFTCARPGRSKGSAAAVPDALVDRWVQNLPGGACKKAIVSMLGQKLDGTSEFSFYSFSGRSDSAAERGGRPLFHKWLIDRKSVV